ncbi:hypothetical protein D3C78_1005750 [compost metagenome]
MTDAGTVINVVSTQHRPGKFLCGVIVLICGTGATDDTHAWRTKFIKRHAKLVGNPRQSFIPGSTPKDSTLFDQRGGQAIDRVDGKTGGPSLGAQLALTERMSGLRFDTDDPVAVHAQPETATHPAERTYAWHDVHHMPLTDGTASIAPHKWVVVLTWANIKPAV